MVDGFLEAVEVRVGEHLAVAVDRAGHQNVQAAEFLLGTHDGGLHGLTVGHIAGNLDGLVPQRLQLQGSGTTVTRPAEVEKGHIGAIRRQCPGTCPANAIRRPGDQHLFARQTHESLCLSIRLSCRQPVCRWIHGQPVESTHGTNRKTAAQFTAAPVPLRAHPVLRQALRLL